MTTIDPVRNGLESRLRDFLSAAAPWLRPARNTGSDRIARLENFFAAAHPYLHRGSPTPLRRVDPTRLGAVLGQLRAPLERQRAEGRALNVWSVAGLKRDEVRNTAVLAELLRHERLGDVARAFLAAIVESARTAVPEFPLIDTLGAYRVSTEVCPMGQRETRVDLVIETDRHVIGVEVKIDAIERPSQLEDYLAILKQRAALDGKTAALIFLTGQRLAVPPRHAAQITWRDVHHAAQQIARQYRTSTRASWLLTDFADHVATLR